MSKEGENSRMRSTIHYILGHQFFRNVNLKCKRAEYKIGLSMGEINKFIQIRETLV
jgi:hypothetical protein